MVRTDILLRLSEACNAHRKTHNESQEKKEKNKILNSESCGVHNSAEKSENIPERCKKDLKSLGAILPKLEEKYNYAVCSDKDASNLCSFYASVIQKGFCPHAWDLFDSGKNGRHIFPRVFHLFQFLLHPPLLQSLLEPEESNQNNDYCEDIYSQIQDTIVRFLHIVPEVSIQEKILNDFVILLEDLETAHQIILNQSQHQERRQGSDKQSPYMQIQVFTTASSDKELMLDIPNMQSLYSLQCTCCYVLKRLYLSRQRRSNNLISSKSTTFLLPILNSVQSILLLQNLETHDIMSGHQISIMILRNKINAAKLLQYILINISKIASSHHCISLIRHQLPSITQIICKATKVHFQLHRGIGIKFSESIFPLWEEFALISWQLLRKIFFFPSPIYDQGEDAFQQLLYSNIFSLLDCIPYLNCISSSKEKKQNSATDALQKRFAKGLLRCIQSILFRSSNFTILTHVRAHCISNSLFHPLFSLMKESQFVGIVSSLLSLLLRNGAQYDESNESKLLEEICFTALNYSTIYSDNKKDTEFVDNNAINDPEIRSSNRNKTPCNKSDRDGNETTPLSQHKRRRIDFDHVQESYKSDNKSSPPKQYTTHIDQLNSSISNETKTIEKDCSLYSLLLKFISKAFQESNYIDSAARANDGENEKMQQVWILTTSQKCLEISGALRLLLSSSTYLDYHDEKQNDRQHENTKASCVIIERLLLAISHLCDSIVWKILHIDKEKQIHGPKRMKKILSVLVSLGFHGYFEIHLHRNDESFRRMRSKMGKMLHDIKSNEFKSNHSLFYRSIGKIAHCALVVMTKIFDDEKDALFEPLELPKNSNKINSNCMGLCYNFCTSFGGRCQNRESTFCLCDLLRGKEQDEFLDLFSCSLIETSLPLQARIIILSCLLPIPNHTLDEQYTSMDRHSILFQLLQSPTLSPSNTACMLGAFPILAMGLIKSIFLNSKLDIKNKYDQARTSLKKYIEKWIPYISARIKHSNVSCRYITFCTLSSLFDLIQLCNESRAIPFIDHLNDHATSLFRFFVYCNDFSKNFHMNRLHKASIDKGISFSKRHTESFDFFYKLVANQSFCLEKSSHIRLSIHNFLSSMILSASPAQLRETKAHLFFSSLYESSKRSSRDELERSSFQSLNNVEKDDTTSTLSQQNEKIDWNSVSPLVWCFCTAFFDPNKNCRQHTARTLGHLLLKNNSAYLFSLFLSEKDWIIWESRHDERDIAASLLTKFFQILEKLMHKYCDISITQLSYTMCDGTAQTISASKTSSYPQNAESESSIGRQFSALSVLSSLCENADIDSINGALIFEGSMLRIVRLWMTKHHDNNDTRIHVASLAFSELQRLNKYRPMHHILSQRKKTFLASLFSEMLIPSMTEGVNGTSERFHYLEIFINTFIIEPTNKTNNYSLNYNCLEYVENILPIVVPTFILEQDYDTLRMMTGFWLYVKNKQRREGKSFKHSRSAKILECSKSYTLGLKKLSEETKHLCVSHGILEILIPKLLLHSERGPIIFFLKTVVDSELNLKYLFTAVQDLVLKSLIWELGGTFEKDTSNAWLGCNYESEEVLLAIKKGALIWTQNKSKNRKSETSQDVRPYNSIEGVDAMDTDAGKEVGMNAAKDWIGNRFMYLLVNVVNMKSRDGRMKERMRALNCLYAMLQFLKPKDAPQYLPQIMSIVDSAICDMSSMKMRFMAVKILATFVRIVLECQVKTIGVNLTSIVVSLFPVLEDTNPKLADDDRKCRLEAKIEAVEFLKILVGGEIGKKLASFFHNIPFLPLASELDPIRTALKSNGVDLDNLLVLTQMTAPNTSSTSDSEIDISSTNSAQLQHALQRRLRILCKMMAHENVSVRKVVIHHLIDLLRANRNLFQHLIESEEAESMRFLTVINDKVFDSSKDNPIKENVLPSTEETCDDDYSRDSAKSMFDHVHFSYICTLI